MDSGLNNETPQTPRKRLAEAVAEQVAIDREGIDAAAIDEAAMEEPKFDTRSGTSNAGRRIAARIQQALRS